jgi:hypothetical protein
MSSFEVNFHEATHVIIHTGYAPPLSYLLNIESVLRNNFENNIECLFANDTNWHLGVMIPNPFGFESYPTHSIKKTTRVERFIKNINSMIDTMMAQCVRHPFYDHASNALKMQREMCDEIYMGQIKNPRLDLYEDLYECVAEWTMKPLSPDREFNYNAYSEMENDESDRINYSLRDCEINMHDDDEPLLSYNARLKETQEIITLLGGPYECDGTLCLKVPLEEYVNPMEILDTIIKNNLSYCASFGMTGIKYVSNDKMKIIILFYDSEHG